MGLNKQAIYFTADAFFAAMLIIGGFLFIYKISTTENPTEHLSYLSSDLLVALDTLPITAINHSFISQEIANGNITHINNSYLEQIAEYWAKGEIAKAETLSTIILNNTLPDAIGARISIRNQTLFEQARNETGNIIASRRMISGIDEGKPFQGSSSYGYLRNIKDKKTSAYAYFGGFIGQGNITVKLEPLPNDLNASRINFILLEADFERYFTLTINGNNCDNLTPDIGNMSADQWNISHCKDLLETGVNNITISFDSLNEAYIGGGYFRVDYETDYFQSNKTYTTVTYDFPQINGIINIFDAVHMPGTLEEMNIHLNYLANHTNLTNTLYLSIGNTTVYTDTNSTDIVSITLSNIILASILDYNQLSNTTIPIRLGFENLTYSTFYTGNADVIIITDVSGSMDWNFTHDYSASTKRNCDNPLINDPTTQRLSVAKCLDKNFASGIINVTGNEVGLVSYESSTDSTSALTINLTRINNAIGLGVGLPAGYVAGGGTCICCGINSAYDLLSAGVGRTTIIARNSNWNYTNESLNGDIPRDGSNRTWYHPDYTLENTWYTGVTVLGHDAGIGGTAIDTDMGSNLSGLAENVNLWELALDAATLAVEFTSGLNSTANTYGIGAANDGWDWASGTYDYAGTFAWFGVSAQELVMTTRNTGTTSSSGSFGVTVIITPAQYAVLQANGTAQLSLTYSWDDYGNYFEDADQMWLKARWQSPTTGAHLIGSQEDTGHTNGDASFEIAAQDNPNIDIVSEYFSQDLSPWIEGPGTYYLEIGGKLLRSASNEWGYFKYDNILLTVQNNTDHYYLRKHFTITDFSDVQRAVINVLSDDESIIYLNGNLLMTYDEPAEGVYWDHKGLSVPGNYFDLGDNVLAVELINKEESARFDLELIGFNESKEKAMMVMTDGVANQECGRQGWTADLDGDGSSDTAMDDAIQAACDAAEDYGISIYAVGFSDSADDATLAGIADCGNGLYRKSQNISELEMFYQDVVLNILEISRQSQSIVVTSGSPASSNIFDGSTITMNYQSMLAPPEPNEIELVFQTPSFGGCEANITIPTGLRVAEAKVTSYSGDHWTSLVQIDNITVFNLSEFADNYTQLGDPFIVQIPAENLASGDHTIVMATGDDNSNTTGCSFNNSLIYTGFVSSTTTRTAVVELAAGCTWTVEFEDGFFQTFAVPSGYPGTKTCTFTNVSHNSALYTADAYDQAVFALLNQLDFDNDGRVFVNLAVEDLEIIVSLVSDVPYLWGPAIVGVELWQ
jgi:hypothetical protein